MARKRGQGADLAIAGDMQPQASYGHQLVIFANAQELSQLLDARTERTARTRCGIDNAHFGNVSGCEFDNPRGGFAFRRRQGRVCFLHHLMEFYCSYDLPARWYLRRRGEVKSDRVALNELGE